MKRPYEIPVVFRIMPEDEFQQAVDQVVAWIENATETQFESAGTVTKIDRNRLGRRRLAYEIDGQRDGWFILFYAEIEPTHLPELELNLKLYEPVLRYLVVRDEKTKKVSVPPPDIMEKAAAADTNDEEEVTD
jgi:small subunit ribosomal protein S6